MKPKYIPERGDAVWIDFNPTRGHEQARRRPAIVLSPKPYNEKGGMMLVCPITSKVKNYPFEVELKAGKLSGVILADQIRNMDWHTRKIAFIQKVPLIALAAAQEQIVQLITEE